MNTQPKIPGVLIGTTGYDQYGLSIVSDTASGDPFINFARPNLGYKGRISYSMAVNQMFFHVDGGNRMTLSDKKYIYQAEICHWVMHLDYLKILQIIHSLRTH